MIDLTAPREAYEKRESDDIGWIKTTENIADAFTKPSPNDGLEEFLDSGILRQSVSQWVVRENLGTKGATGAAERMVKDDLVQG